MVKLQYTAKAVKDLNGIYSFISPDSILYAKAFIAILRQRVTILKKYPEFGHPFFPDKFKGLRQVTYKSYRIIYHFSGSEITVITIQHQSKLPENINALQDFKIK